MIDVDIRLLYGKNGYDLSLPADVEATIIRKPPMDPIADPDRAVREALEHPVGVEPLSRLARGKRNACILVCDITRPVPNGTLLPPLLETLNAAGIPDDRITILIATGLHRPNEGEEMREVIGNDEVLRRVRVENHFARRREDHVDLGTTAQGIPMIIDKRFVEADVKIVTGLVEPHFMAGYSGGRKVVAPGVAYQDTILHFHSARVLEHPRAVSCVLEGNPLHQSQLEIVRAVGNVLALNVAIDEDRRIGYVNFGEVEASHLRTVEYMRKHAEVKLPRKFKTVVTTSAGYPLDKTYYQTVKGMVGVSGILEEGGDVIIASEISEGMGSEEFVQAQKLLAEKGLDHFMEILHDRDKALIDEWQTEMLVKILRIGKVHLYSPSGLPKLVHPGVEAIDSIEEAVRRSVEKHGDRHIAVVPEGPYVVPLADELPAGSRR